MVSLFHDSASMGSTVTVAAYMYMYKYKMPRELWFSISFMYKYST